MTNGYFSSKSHPSPLSLHRYSPTTTPFALKNSSASLKLPPVRAPQSPVSGREPKAITRTLSLSLRSCTSPKVDLIHDDWLGLAPLASPESLSELSSISSRTSLVTKANVTVEINSTPKIMRRTTKIIGSLSNCADDIRNVRNFQKAKTFTRLLTNNNTESSSSSNLSYESASSSTKCCGGRSTAEEQCPTLDCGETECEPSDNEFQSAEDILDHVLASAGCKEFFNSESNFLETHFDLGQLSDPSPSVGYFGSCPITYPQAMSPTSPREIDQDLISNLAIDLNLDAEHRALHFQQPPSRSHSHPSSSTDSGTPCDHPKNVTFNPQVVTVDATVCEPPRWRHLFRGKRAEPPPPVAAIGSGAPIKTILSTKRRSEDGGECFARTEALPLLSGLGSGGSDSPGFARRKKYVYPLDVVVVTQHPNESTV